MIKQKMNNKMNFYKMNFYKIIQIQIVNKLSKI